MDTMIQAMSGLMMTSGKPEDGPTRTGNVLPRLTPFGIFGTADEQFVAICATTDALAAGLFRAMGIEDPAADPRLATRDGRVASSDEVTEMIEGWTRQHSREELMELLAEHGVPVTAVREPSEAVADPLLLARGETLPIEHPVYGAVAEVHETGMPIRAASGGYGLRRHAPGLGEHNAVAYGEVLGYSPERIEELRDAGVI